MQSSHILIVDDETTIRDMVRMALEQDGFTVSDARNAHEAMRILEQSKIDLILLDWMMPGVAGIDFAARLRRENRVPNTAIIMLTARDTEEDLIRGLAEGADDYIRKPFSTRELVSRIRAVLRRFNSNSESSDVINIGKLSIDIEQHIVCINNDEIRLSPTEFRLLYFFMTYPERAFTRDQLLDNVWGNHAYVEDRTVDVHIRRLRKVLEQYQCDNYIATVRGVGYRFARPKQAS